MIDRVGYTGCWKAQHVYAVPSGRSSLQVVCVGTAAGFLLNAMAPLGVDNNFFFWGGSFSFLGLKDLIQRPDTYDGQFKETNDPLFDYE